MDALSEVLKTVKLDSAFFFNAEFSAPWSFRSPASLKLAPYINSSGGHVIIYHLLIEGQAYAQLGDERLAIVPGDVVIFPHGDSHTFESGPGPGAVDAEGELLRIFSQGLKLSRMGGGGEVARFVCGFMVCEPSLSQVFLAGLPAMFKVNIRQEQSGRWLENSIRYSLADTNTSDAGAQAVLAKLSEALFIETLRRYMSVLPEEQTGWLAGARDAEVARVLALIHRQPAAPWTVAALAREAGISRPVLAARFRECLGEPPVAYLTRWRLQLGAQMLSSTSDSVAQILQSGLRLGTGLQPSFQTEFRQPARALQE